MIGLETIKCGLSAKFEIIKKQYASAIYYAFADLLQWSQSNDFLFPYFHQNDFRGSELKLEHHGLSWYFLKSYIATSDCYMIYIKVPEMAMSNKYIKELEKWEVDGIEFNVNNSPQGSDGYIKLTKPLELKKLYLNDDQIDNNLKTIILKENTIIPLEVGTNDLCKMYSVLLIEPNLTPAVCRLPYRFNENNLMAVFYCPRNNHNIR